ncbi:MAG: bifunctional metallophosphatase/5'-nucleotidase [Candidatus Korarchaeota archaeon]|nr:bifunctional metallophosphatase/5'-nucleotidase [Candidatus Korarchaeota archaeon]NIU84961.1 bifunctional metallophosphatase/5'-nucleotidase [Candidatus Thorarchaeota archaeon]NIW14984.1 bifunctional metallophosphatase/5'-nucleotidase [Candidatus Thorarchaeota archaeon]NIW52994.1 bifunctional metallophosphatase/5'-nucleotidase [Candidatus Korarchaeota archaeon]
MNDSHAYFERHPEYFWKNGEQIYENVGGYARIATILRQCREARSGTVLALDNGDTIHGTFPAVHSEGETLIPILNAMEFDAMTGHWEFAYGPEQFLKVANTLSYPTLAVNCYDSKTGKRVFPAYQIIERNDMQIGVIGIAATIIDKTMPTSFSKGVYFTLGNEELPGIIRELRDIEQVDLIVVVSHLGYPQELQLAQEVDGIDVLLSGHTHNRLYDAVVVNDTIIIQSGCHGSFIGRLDLEIANRRVKSYQHDLITVDDSIEPDPEVNALVDKALDPHRDMLDTVVGHTQDALARDRVMETTMDNLLLHALISVSDDAELAFSNGWRYGAPVPLGPVTMNDVWNIVPVNPAVSTCDLSGIELWNMLEENLERTFSRDPYQQMGGYVKRCLGMNMYFKVENPKNRRINELFVGSTRVERSKKYKAVFITSQGVPVKYGDHRKDLNIRAVEALSTYLRENSPVSSKLEGNVVPI